MKKVFLYFCFLFFASNALSQPSNTDYVWGYGGIAGYAFVQFSLQPFLAPHNPHWERPNDFDIFFRQKIKWGQDDLNKAALYSDVLLKGIFLPGIFWTPLLAKQNYGYHLLLNLQVTAATGLLTNCIKYIAGRQRPYSYFGTLDSNGLDDYLSFFSGHSSFSFALATSASMIFEKSNPHISGLIWSSSILLACITGYFRLAADRHYITDVLTEGLTGSFTGYLVTKSQSKRFFRKNNSSEDTIIFKISIPLSY